MAARRIARYGRKNVEESLGCPFGVFGATPVEPLGPGASAEIPGKGGSTTSALSRTGFGASAGGMYDGLMTCMRLPG